MTHFIPASEKNHRLAGAGHNVPDLCLNCGADLVDHTNGLCPEVCPDCGDPTENGKQCAGCMSAEAVRR